jgi:hypothetical protein
MPSSSKAVAREDSTRPSRGAAGRCAKAFKAAGDGAMVGGGPDRTFMLAGGPDRAISSGRINGSEAVAALNRPPPRTGGGAGTSGSFGGVGVRRK